MLGVPVHLALIGDAELAKGPEVHRPTDHRALGSSMKGRVRVRLSDASGIAVEERIWFNGSTDAAALAEEVADHIARRVSGRVDLEATITISDGG